MVKRYFILATIVLLVAAGYTATGYSSSPEGGPSACLPELPGTMDTARGIPLLTPPPPVNPKEYATATNRAAYLLFSWKTQDVRSLLGSIGNPSPSHSIDPLEAPWHRGALVLPDMALNIPPVTPSSSQPGAPGDLGKGVCSPSLPLRTVPQVPVKPLSIYVLKGIQHHEKHIGGQRDEHGCLVAAGYSWNENAKACIREWELNEDQKKAAKIAVEYLNPIKGVTIKSVDVLKCPGCFSVNLILDLNSGKKEVSVTLENWQVTIDSFEACVNAGNPIMESYPRQCSANGQTFVEKIERNEVADGGGHVCTAEDIAAEACIMIYDPVCGDDGIIYGNGCTACSSGNINRYVLGECKKQSTDDGTVYCTPGQKSAEFCTFEYMPVCGNDGKTYGNKCSACASGNIDSYIPGECTTIKECGPCPNFMPPAPGWCAHGVIIPGQKDECGCQAPPQCEEKAIDADEAQATAVQAIKAKRPEFMDYPSTSLPPKAIISEAGEDNGWYIAFVQEGSGRPVISATCFFVDKGGNILSEKQYTPTEGEDLTAPFSARTCSPGACTLETCHGLDIQCGPEPAGICTAMYQAGDICLQYARCGIQNGTCQQVQDQKFTACKSCVQQCEKDFSNDPEKVFACESKCRQ